MQPDNNKRKIYYLKSDKETVNIDDKACLINSDEHKAQYQYVLDPTNPAPLCKIETDGNIQEFKKLSWLGFCEKTFRTQRYRILGNADDNTLHKCKNQTQYWDNIILKWDIMQYHFDFGTAPIGFIIKQNPFPHILLLTFLGTATYCIYALTSLICQTIYPLTISINCTLRPCELFSCNKQL